MTRLSQQLFTSYNINSAMMFCSFLAIFGVLYEIETGLKTLFTVIGFTILFWIANSLQASKTKDNDK